MKSSMYDTFYSPFCVKAKIIKLVGLKNDRRLQGVPDKVIHYICKKLEPLWPLFQISFMRMETTYYKDKPQKIVR
jgi:hypothetical protein